MNGWAGTDSSIGKYVRAQAERTIRVYAEDPELVHEHAHYEDDLASGGYAERQIVELVQNAADQLIQPDRQSERRICVRLTSSTLYVADDGDPLDEKGVNSLLHAHLLAKGHVDEIGRFGVGFKSVLSVSNSPALFSRSGSIEFDRKKAISRISCVVPNAERYPVLRTADSVCPLGEATSDAVLSDLMAWAVNIVRLPLIDTAYTNLQEQIRLFRAEFLLFVPHVKRFDMLWGDDTLGVSSRTIKLHKKDETHELEDGPQKGRWKLFRSVHQLRSSANASRRWPDGSDQVRITWAAPLDVQSRHHHFWVYFPTATSSLVHGIFNATWKTNEDRENLLSGHYNSELVEAAAHLVAAQFTRLRSKEDPSGGLKMKGLGSDV